MAKSSFFAMCLFISQVLFLTTGSHGSLFGLDDVVEYEEPSEWMERCEDNSPFCDGQRSCNPTDETLRNEIWRNCPRKCKTCSGDTCKDNPKEVDKCKAYKPLCGDVLKMTSRQRAMSTITYFRNFLWENCRRTCNFKCAPKAASAPKCNFDEGCCWHDIGISKIDPKCRPCRDFDAKFRRPICPMFASQCKCEPGQACENRGKKFIMLCPETCGVKCNEEELDVKDMDALVSFQ